MENNLKTYRQLRKYTLQDVSQLLGVSIPALSYYESGKRNIPSELLPKFAELYGCSVDDLMGNKEIQLDALTPIEPIKILKPNDEMEQELLKRFRSLSFDDKMKAISYITNLKK